jgi:hypothetical protein
MEHGLAAMNVRAAFASRGAPREEINLRAIGRLRLITT